MNLAVKPEVGDRIRVTGPVMFGGSRPGELDPCAPPVGAQGTVNWVNTWEGFLTRQFRVTWDNGLYVRMLLGEDPYEITTRKEHSDA